MIVLAGSVYNANFLAMASAEFSHYEAKAIYKDQDGSVYPGK
jgi:hypothetical protein